MTPVVAIVTGMEQPFDSQNNDDDEGNPAGGYVDGVGLHIRWQDGPLGRGEHRSAPNGAFVETVLAAAKQRIQYYQRSRFACDENAEALGFIEQALMVLHQRTAQREARKVEGTHAV